MIIMTYLTKSIVFTCFLSCSMAKQYQPIIYQIFNSRYGTGYVLDLKNGYFEVDVFRKDGLLYKQNLGQRPVIITQMDKDTIFWEKPVMVTISTLEGLSDSNFQNQTIRNPNIIVVETPKYITSTGIHGETENVDSVFFDGANVQFFNKTELLLTAESNNLFFDGYDMYIRDTDQRHWETIRKFHLPDSDFLRRYRNLPAANYAL